MATRKKSNRKQNVTVGLDRATIEMVKMIAARQSISLSELVARRIEAIFGQEGSYERAEQQVRETLDSGFHLGGGVRVGRDELHERKESGGRPDLENRRTKSARRKERAT